MRNLARVHAGRPARFAGLRGAYAGGGVSGRQVPEVNAAYIKGIAPVAWFRWGIGITIATGVSQWNDQSGNANHLKQATGGNQPTKNADGSIRFVAASSHFMNCTAFTLNQPETVYLLAKQVAWAGGLILCDGNTGATMRLAQTTASPGVSMVDAGSLGPNNGWAVGKYACVACVYNGATSVLQANNTAPTSGALGTTGAGGFYLGAAPAGAFSDLEVREVIIFAAAHNSDTRRNVTRYLMDLGKVAQ